MKPINTNKSLKRIQVVGYLSVVLALGGAGYWSATSALQGAVIAPATIVTETFSKRVQHKEGGIVAEILVRDGDRVTEGQNLVTLDATDVQSELSVIDAASDELRVKQARLEAQRDGNNDILLSDDVKKRLDDPAFAQIFQGQMKLLVSTVQGEIGRKAQLRKQMGQLDDQIKGLDAQISSRRKQAAIVVKELAKLRSLQKEGLVQTSRVLSAERDAATIEGEIGQLGGNLAAAQSRIGEIELQMLQLEDDRRSEALTELRDVEAKIAELAPRRISVAAKLRQLVIKSPITGTVYQLAVNTRGGVIGAGETLMLIVPEAEQLELQAQVMPNDVDQVHQGQKAQIRFPGLDARTTPEIFAEVKNVAGDVSRTDAQSLPFYSVRLVIPLEELKKLGEGKLRPGMGAEAFIQTESRSPLSYLVKPLIDQITHAMRES